MRCDIGRICILHSYGGLYADLDTQPNRECYEGVDFALQRVEVPLALRRGKVTWALSQGAWQIYMEVIIGSSGNLVFLDWLQYIELQIAKKSYTDKSSFWYIARM